MNSIAAPIPNFHYGYNLSTPEANTAGMFYLQLGDTEKKILNILIQTIRDHEFDRLVYNVDKGGSTEQKYDIALVADGDCAADFLDPEHNSGYERIHLRILPAYPMELMKPSGIYRTLRLDLAGILNACGSDIEEVAGDVSNVHMISDGIEIINAGKSIDVVIDQDTMVGNNEIIPSIHQSAEEVICSSITGSDSSVSNRKYVIPLCRTYIPYFLQRAEKHLLSLTNQNPRLLGISRASLNFFGFVGRQNCDFTGEDVFNLCFGVF